MLTNAWARRTVIFVFLLAACAPPSSPFCRAPLDCGFTFGVMYCLGYSLNNLSVMALTHFHWLCGRRRASVMIENIFPLYEQGESPACKLRSKALSRSLQQFCL